MRLSFISQTISVVTASSILLTGVTGCKSAQKHRQEADKASYDIVQQKQQEAVGKNEPFKVETPADTLRRRMLLEQNLPYSTDASLGVHNLKPIAHWPKDPYLSENQEALPGTPEVDQEPLRITLFDALRIGAHNSRNYQEQKERVYRAALNLDLERDFFRPRFNGTVDNQITADLSGHDEPGDNTRIQASSSPRVGLDQTFKNGARITTALTMDLVKLLTDPYDAALGLLSDSSISIPLLRGSGEWVVAEPLTQAEREVVYAILEFEQFKKDFVVNISTLYFQVLRQFDSTQNSEDSYKRLIVSALRSRRLSDAGRLQPIQLDQAVQAELQARDSWIRAIQQLGNQIDLFKVQLGLPADALIDFDRGELDRLNARAEPLLAAARRAAGEASAYSLTTQPSPEQLPSPRISDPQAKGPDTRPAPVTQPSDVVLVPPSTEAGPLELPEEVALAAAFKNRPDLRVAQGNVFDAQRRVAIAADALGPGFNLGASANFGTSPLGNPIDFRDAQLRPDRGRYTGSANLDLPFERTAERNRYRASLIDLEQSVRSLHELEDQIKIDVRSSLRALQQQRESLINQTKQVQVADRRVKSSDRYFEAGRAAIRDVLESQTAFVQAQNSFTQALVSYRVTELNLQRDLGVLEVDHEGQWREYEPSRDPTLNGDAPTTQPAAPVPVPTNGTASRTAPATSVEPVRPRAGQSPVSLRNVSAAVPVAD